MKLFTTGQVSKICNVATSTVNKWFDSGKLKGFRVPGSRHRRIPREKLIEFLTEYGVPIGTLDRTKVTRVLIVSRDPSLIDYLQKESLTAGMFDMAVVDSTFEAGFEAETFQPDCIIVDFAIGEGEAAKICQNFRKKTEVVDPVLIAILPENTTAAAVRTSGLSDKFIRPFDLALLVERLRTLIGIADVIR